MTITFQSYTLDHPAVREAGLSRYSGETWWVEFRGLEATRAIGLRKDGRHVLLDLAIASIDQNYLFPIEDEEMVRKEFEQIWDQPTAVYARERD